MKILIVEDDRPLAASLRALLEDRGYEVENAYDGETGVQYALLGVYDLIILDVMRPGRAWRTGWRGSTPGRTIT